MPSKFSVRTWGTRFDSLPPSSPPLGSPKSSAAATESGDQPSDSPFVKNSQKTPHDASVFVGSLPIDVDFKELGASLSQHLAEFAPVKSVKVIRDSKGGVCAFVQCEDANSASKLIQTLQSSAPKPFFGRILRFEAARAYRSLLISYRTPTQKIIATDDASSAEKTVELTLPSAMRINKFSNSKSAAIFYNNEAVHLQRQAGNSIHEKTFFKAPVFYDAATLKAICAFFGPLEHFKLYEVEENIDNKESSSFPAPHDAPRKPYMDQGCFDVKWVHRDDCTSALMTLRRVPHLTVTWAHVAPEREASLPNGFNQPYPLFPRLRSVSDSTGHCSALSFSAPPSHSNATIPNDCEVVSQSTSEHHGTILRSHVELDCNQKAPGLETDFPPLVDRRAQSHSEFDGVWAEEPSVESEKEKTEGGFSNRSSFGLAHPGAFVEVLGDVHPLKSHSGYRSVAISTTFPDASQELELQHTPGLARSPVTPKTPGSLFPPTPTSFHGERPTLFSKEDDELSYRTEGQSGEQILDPTTLFVGGLEMRGASPWDEGKVYRLFEKYGGLESVKVIRPNSGKAAFAFVRFGNTEGPTRAIAELHNYLIEGRPLRVQLRDCNPSRSPFRVVRGRGRYLNHHGHQFRQGLQSDSKRDKSVDASLGEPTLDTSLVIDASLPSEPPSVELISEPGKATESDVTRSHRSDMERSPQTQEPEVYREWYDVEHQVPVPMATPIATPPVGGSFTPEGGSGIPYSLPTFYAPGPWMHPAHVQYPMAFYPPIYAVPPNPQPPRYSGSSGSDASGPTSCPPAMPSVPWNASASYGYIPYHGFAPRSADQSSQGQAPVVPTGFFRDEAGTLIPVYPRAIIDQYMTNNPSQSSSPPMGVTVTVPATVPSPIPIPPTGPIQTWASPGPIFGSGPNQFPPRVVPHSNQIQGQPSGWITPPQSMNPQGHLAPGLPPLSGMPMIGALPFRDGFHGGMGQVNGHKRQGRRDYFHGKRNGGLRGRASVDKWQ